MSASIGRLTARLAEPIENVTLDLINLINSNISPPEAVGEDDVYIRAMYIVSDQVNSFGGCFPVDEHEKLCELLIDSPVMVGHQKDHLPIGRNFYAKTVEKEGRQWVKCYFYWLKNADGAETLRENIDGGIYKECSIGFTFLFPECSACGKDIRTCRHEPFEEYEISGNKTACYFNYRQIERVLETSLVYRGAVADTSISKDLKADNFKSSAGNDKIFFKEKEIQSPLELDPSCRYVVTPYYEGLPVLLNYQNKELTIKKINSSNLPESIIAQFEDENIPEIENILGIIIGFRGKERCSLSNLQKYLDGKSSPVTRLELKLFPDENIKLINNHSESRFLISSIRHCYADVVGVTAAARSIMTREGVRLWPENEDNPKTIYKYKPGINNHANVPSGGNESFYSLHFSEKTGHAWFSIGYNSSIERFIIRQFNLSRLLKGGRFIADRLSRVDAVNISTCHIIQCGQVVGYKNSGEGITMNLSGNLRGDFIIQPIKIEKQNRWLFYRGNIKGQISV